MERVLMTKTTIEVVQRSEHFSVRRRCEVVSEQFQKDSPSADKISVKTQIYMKRLLLFAGVNCVRLSRIVDVKT